jgi:hypothetical protein
MWSVEYHGGYSKFNDKQRILYGLMCDKEEEKKGLVKAVTSGGCTGIYLLDPDDESALQVAQNTLVTAYNKKDSLSRKDFMIISESGMLWKEEEYKSNIEQLSFTSGKS